MSEVDCTFRLEGREQTLQIPARPGPRDYSLSAWTSQDHEFKMIVVPSGLDVWHRDVPALVDHKEYDKCIIYLLQSLQR